MSHSSRRGLVLGTSILLVFLANTVASRSLSQQVEEASYDSTVSTTAAQCTKVEDVDFWGADIVRVGNVATAGNCCTRCFNNKNCERWTYAPDSKRCWLKRETGWIRKESTGKISGRVVRSGDSNPTPVPSPPVIVDNPPADAEPRISPIPSNGKYSKSNYGDVLGLSWRFYEAQRSGELPKSNRISWRESAHTNDVVPGGWYDAGDYLKLNFPMASTVSILAWGLVEFKDGYQTAGERDNALTNLRVAADYLKRCHIASRKYVGQIGHPDVDHDFWGRADQEKTARPAYVYDSSMAASDLLGKVTAALASSAVVWQDIDADFSADLLNHAKDIYEWGTEKDGKYSSYYKSATHSIYPSSDSADDMAWGAYWMYRATNNRKYLDDCVTYYKKKDWDVTSDWDNSGAMAAVALANLVEDGVSVPNGANIKDWVVNTFLKSWSKPSGEIVSTPKGMARPKWSKWGNLQLSTTASFLALAHAKHSTSADTRATAMDFARKQLDYAMGSSGRSFVVGFGDKYPLRPHHAGASCPDRPAKCDWPQFDSSKPNPQILYGALVAGPSGPGDDTYNDKRNDYVTNEVALDYNAGFTSALAGLVQLI